MGRYDQQCRRVSFDRALELLEEARKVSDGEPVAEVMKRVAENRAHLWLGVDCAGVTEYSPTGLHIQYAGGSLKGLLAMREDVESFARLSGCKRVELSGRKGWFRLFRRFGYVQEGDEMVKAL